jgi:hypothetical protein
MPKLGLFEGREPDLPYDYDDLLRLIAPRPCLIVAPERDRDHAVSEVRACIERARSTWPTDAAETALTALHPNDIGRFQSAQHRRFLQWLQSLCRE